MGRDEHTKDYEESDLYGKGKGRYDCGMITLIVVEKLENDILDEEAGGSASTPRQKNS